MAATERKNSGSRKPLAANVVSPFARAGSYYARSWGAYLEGRDSGDNDGGDLPLARPTLSLATHALRDELVLVGLLLRRPVSDTEAFQRLNAEITDATELYRERGWFDDPQGFFPTPPAAEDVTIRSITKGRRTHERMSFDSGYAPHPGEPGAERYLSYTANHRAYALMLRHREPRPWLVCIHGTEMGRAAMDVAVFRARHLHEDLGLNVMLPVLPMHGPRARGLPKGAVYPGQDMMDNVHATAQSVWDIRRILAWIRTQQPGARIGVNGISLGGYLAALLASLDDDLTCAILGVPPSNLVELLARHAGFADDDPRQETLELARPIGRMISPLSLPPKIAPQGRFIYAGVADRVVHPRQQVLHLWEHWGRPDVGWYRGGHTGFFTARPVQRYVDDALVGSGLIEN